MPRNALTAAQRRRVAISLVLFCAWLAITVVLGFIGAVISTSETSSGIEVVPFIVAACVAAVDRARNRLTALGLVAVVVASIAVVIVAVVTLANVWRGGGYVLAGIASCVAVMVAAGDLLDRWGAARPT